MRIIQQQHWRDMVGGESDHRLYGRSSQLTLEQEILHPFFRAWECYEHFWSHHPLNVINTIRKGTWLDYRWPLVLGPDWIFVFLHLRWLKQIYIQGKRRNDVEGIKDSFMDSSTNSGFDIDQYAPVIFLVWLGKEIVVSVIEQEKTYLESIIVETLPI